MRSRSLVLPLMVASLSFSLGCRERPRNPVPPPPFGSIDSASHGDIIKYAASLAYDTLTGSSDRQALAVATVPGGKCPRECTYGPVARIAPQAGSLFYSAADLEGGRFVGRVINEDDVAYEKLNLGPRDTVYAWVQSRGGKLEGRLVSSDPKRLDQSRTVRVVTQPDGAHPAMYRQSTARWIWTEDDEGMWYTCNGRCCEFRENP